MSKEFSIWKRLVVTSVLTFFISYIATVIVFGIIWAPNGAILLEHTIADPGRIIFTGLLMCLPLAMDLFTTNHPVPVAMGLGYLAIAVIELAGREQAAGRSVLYALVAMFTICTSNIQTRRNK